jgi:hypothetical protein
LLPEGKEMRRAAVSCQCATAKGRSQEAAFSFQRRSSFRDDPDYPPKKWIKKVILLSSFLGGTSNIPSKKRKIK